MQLLQSKSNWRSSPSDTSIYNHSTQTRQLDLTTDWQSCSVIWIDRTIKILPRWLRYSNKEGMSRVFVKSLCGFISSLPILSQALQMYCDCSCIVSTGPNCRLRKLPRRALCDESIYWYFNKENDSRCREALHNAKCSTERVLTRGWGTSQLEFWSTKKVYWAIDMLPSLFHAVDEYLMIGAV
jgi:hypothetical protein